MHIARIFILRKMSQPSDSVACYHEPMYSNAADEKSDWSKSKPMSFSEQLEKWNKVRQSLYSQSGWCSTNVNQISKWDVGDLDSKSQSINQQKHRHETGTNIWNANLSQKTMKPCPIVPDTSTAVVTAATVASTCYAPQLELDEWKSKGAIPKMFNLGNINCLSMNASNFEFPYGSPSQTPQLNTTVFHDCDTNDSTTEHADDVNLALRLQLETMNLDTDTTNRAPNLNQISNICQIPKQYQVDCLPQAFS